MQIFKRAFYVVSVLLTTVLFSSSTFAVCFASPQEYEAVKRQLPAQFRRLPMIFVMSGMANAAVKVQVINGKFRITSGIWSPFGISYGDERLKLACVRGDNLSLKIANGSMFAAVAKGNNKVDVIATDANGKPQKGTFNVGTETEYVQKISYINDGAIRQGITPPVGVQ